MLFYKLACMYFYDNVVSVFPLLINYKIFLYLQVGGEYAIKRATLKLNKFGEKELSLKKETTIRSL